jgi:ATP-dependent Lon protease
MKGYMESGEFSRGKDSIRGFGSMVMVGNFDVDVTHQQRVSHLFGPLPKEMRDDTAFMDRLHCYLPGWDMPKMSKDLLTDHFGLVSDFLALCWNSLRQHNRKQKFGDKIHLGAALSGRDTGAVEKTMNGLLKLMFPDGSAELPEEAIEWAARLALECRRRVKEQQKRLVPTEYRNTQFSYHMGGEGVEKFVGTPEIHQENSIGDDPLPPGQVWVMSPGGTDEAPGLFRIDVTVGPGSSVRLLNQPAPPPLKESVRCAEQNMYARAKELVGDRDPRSHEFSVQARAFDGNKSGSGTGLGVLLGLSSGLLEKSLKGGLVVVGSLNLGGSIETIFNPVAVVEAAADKGAKVILMPISTRRQLVDLPDEVATRVVISHYSDAKDALIKALG